MRRLYCPYSPFVPILLPRVCPQSALKEIVAIPRVVLSLDIYSSPFYIEYCHFDDEMMKSSVDAMVFYPFEMIPDKGRVVFLC